jgi:hypothetical protein
MNRRFAWLGGGVGAFAVWRWLRRRPAPAARVEELDPRAEELRAKLAESKAVVDERAAFEEGETPVDEADPDARRRSVHEAARARLDELRGE